MAIFNRSLSNSDVNVQFNMQIQSVEDRIESFLAKKFRRSRSFATKRCYKVNLSRFTEFLSVKYNVDINQLIILLESKQKDPLDVLDDYYTFLSEYLKKDGKPYSTTTIKEYLMTSKEFLNSVGCKIYIEDMKQKFTLPKRTVPYQEGITKEQINRLLRLANRNLATIILMACSSGMRISEILQLKLSDVNLDVNPTTITLRRETTKTRETRITCISSEATKALHDYITKYDSRIHLSSDQYLFLKSHKMRLDSLKTRLETDHYKNHILKNRDTHRVKLLEKEMIEFSLEEQYSRSLITARQNYENQLRKLISEIPELSKRNENGQYVIHFHAFRAWFKTQVTDAHQSDFAEALMGHKSIKLVYYRQNEKKRSQTYLDVEYALTITNTDQIDQNYSDIQRDNQELRNIVDNLSRQLQNLEKKIRV
jgi:integrase